MIENEVIERITSVERLAMVGDRLAVVAMVSHGRRLRALFDKMLAARYGDGAIDGATSSMCESEYEDAVRDLAATDV